MKRAVIIVIIGTFVLGLIMSFSRYTQTGCPIDPWIKENYLIDCQMMVRERINPWDAKSELYIYRDSIRMPQIEVKKYLSILSAVNVVNDSVFKKYNVRHKGERYSWLPLSFDMKQPWMKKLFQTKGKSGNKVFDDIMAKYKFKCRKVSDGFHIAEFYSDEILNVGPIIDQLEKIKGVQNVPGDREFVIQRINYDSKDQTIELKYFADQIKSDYALLKKQPDIRWKYKIEDCKAIEVK